MVENEQPLSAGQDAEFRQGWDRARSSTWGSIAMDRTTGRLQLRAVTAQDQFGQSSLLCRLFCHSIQPVSQVWNKPLTITLSAPNPAGTTTLPPPRGPAVGRVCDFLL